MQIGSYLVKKVKAFYASPAFVQCCLFVVCAYFSYRLLEPVHLETFFYDSQVYWLLAETFAQDGRFSFEAYGAPMRGYAFPLLLHLIDYFHVSRFDLVKILSSITNGLFFGFVVPGILGRIFGIRNTAPGALACFLITFYFWNGYMVYPLTDLYAAFFIFTGILLLHRPGRLCMSGCGLLFALALNFRPVYLLCPLVLLLFLVAQVIIHKASRRLHMVRFSLALAGMLLILFPQAWLNFKTYGLVSPLVQTRSVYGNGLLLFQLSEGISLQKYETNIGNGYPMGAVRYLNGAGIRDTFVSMQQYMGYVLQHPARVAAIYTRHLFNGIDNRYDEVYISHVHERKELFRWLNCTLFFLALGLVLLFCRRPGRRLAFYLLLVLLPCLAVIPMAVEVRYFFPLHLLAYMLVSFFAWKKLLSRFVSERRLLLLAVAYVGFSAVWMWMSESCVAQLEYGHMPSAEHVP